MLIIEAIKINSEMIALARESRGMSQKDLADKLGISRALLCQLEQNNRSVQDEMLEKLEKTLNYPRSFFTQEGDAYRTSVVSFRRRLKVPNSILSSIEANIQVYRLHIETILAKNTAFESLLPQLDLKQFENVQAVAKKIRTLWNIQEPIIENLTELLESKGIITIQGDFGTERVDSRSFLTRKGNPVIVYNKSLLGDRQRFTLAYELGHLILHTSVSDYGDRDIDHEANLFAAEFLMPESEIRSEFKEGISVTKLADLKRKWKVSMIALLYRAHDLEELSYNQRTYLITQFNQLNIRRREPDELDVPVEKPTLLRDLITKYKKALRLSVKELADVLHITEEDFTARYSTI